MIRTEPAERKERLKWAAALGAMVGLGLLVACGSSSSTPAKCGEGTRIQGDTCVAVSGSSTSGSTSGGDVPDGGGSNSSSSGSTSSGAGPDAGDSGPKLPAGCPTEVTDPAAKLLYINCDPACGGDIELCRRGSGPYGQMLCRPASEPKVAIDKLERLPEVGLGTPWRRVLVRLPKDPVSVYGACDPQGLEMPDPNASDGILRPQPAMAVFIRTARYKPIEKEQWFTARSSVFFSAPKRFQLCVNCLEDALDPLGVVNKEPRACREYDAELYSDAFQGLPGRTSQGVVFLTDRVTTDATTLDIANGNSCGVMP
jgi:hypothetical protein